MSLTFDEVMEFTRGVSSHAAFEDDECRAYFDALMSLPNRCMIVEVGLQFGRSSSIAAQVAKYKDALYVGVDPFIEPPEAGPQWVAMMQKLDVDFVLMKMKSEDTSRWPPLYPHAVLIDGDHTWNGVLHDLIAWHDYVEPNGLMLFHDYGRESLPDVYPTVYRFLSNKPGWRELPTVGTLGTWRKEIRD